MFIGFILIFKKPSKLSKSKKKKKFNDVGVKKMMIVMIFLGYNSCMSVLFKNIFYIKRLYKAN